MIFLHFWRFYATSPVGVSCSEYQERICSILWEYQVFVTDSHKKAVVRYRNIWYKKRNFPNFASHF